MNGTEENEVVQMGLGTLEALLRVLETHGVTHDEWRLLIRNERAAEAVGKRIKDYADRIPQTVYDNAELEQAVVAPPFGSLQSAAFEVFLNFQVSRDVLLRMLTDSVFAKAVAGFIHAQQ